MSKQSSVHKNVFYLYAILAAFLICCFSPPGHAQNAKTEQEIKLAVAGMTSAAMPGPLSIPLGNQATLKLPEKFAFIPKVPAERFMRAVGNSVDKDFIGLIFGDHLEGFVSIEFAPAGYIKDDDAKKWNVDELLDNLKEGTRQSNKERTKRGIPTLEVQGWIEKPDYDANNHRLVWSISAHQQGQAANAEQNVNYNTYLLGREGYLSLNLVSDSKNIGQEKPLAKELLAAVSFNNGKRYEDFNASTDKVAEYGIAALVGGLAAKKLGLLAMFGVFFVKFWKLLIIGLLAFGAIFKKFFRRGDV